MKCDICKQEIKPEKEGGVGYAVTTDGKKRCYECCADRDRITMIEDGHSKALPLYYDENTNEITNWPGTLRFKAWAPDKSRHNWGLTRIDVRFPGPDNHIWHGYTIGHNTQIIHCKRTKKMIYTWEIVNVKKRLGLKTGNEYIIIRNKYAGFISQNEIEKANEMTKEGWEITEMAIGGISLMRKRAGK